ncbi:MAG TPA: glycoside hydrolase family 2 TIM barrel-domain containing protein [Kofleriaceae bacterium]|nr:glycoside hydrolase family 2 TIM barrel-domain containing protein [Kofleriaceae bacterium]
MPETLLVAACAIEVGLFCASCGPPPRALGSSPLALGPSSGATSDVGEAARIRQVVELDRGWRFRRAATPAAERPDLDDTSWQEVDLPHTWNAVDGQDGGNDYHRGVGWYRKRFAVPAAAAGRRLFLEVDGASIAADVHLNGRHVGQHRGACARFRLDVTGAALPGRENLLAIAVDNAETPDVAPLTGADFTYFGGLYRGVRLVMTDPLHVDALDAGGPGIHVRQRRVTRASADVDIETLVRNDGGAAAGATVEAIVFDAEGRAVARASRGAGLIAPGARAVVAQSIHMDRPRLWNGLASGALDPYLYRVEVRVLGGDGRVADAVSVPLGLRFFDIDPVRGFSLNGGPYRQLHGVGLHQDWSGRGWATSPAQRRRNLDLAVELGADAVRLTHYQHAQDTYDEADRRGLLVWTEVPVINRIAATGEFAASARQQLGELIAQTSNHPSVFTWGIANEPLLHDGPDPVPLLRELDGLAHRLDPTRPTVLASHMAQEPGPATHPSHEVSDLLAFNAYYGWYYGAIDDLAPWIARYRRDNPARAIALSEFGAGAGIERHAARPAARDLSEEYQVLFLDRHLAATARAELWAAFIWVLADFAADHRTDSSRPGINDKGLVTHDRRVRKDAFYAVKAHWSRAPTLRIASRRFRRREADTAEVAVITNLDRVEVRVDGARLGAPAREPGSRVLRWRDVPLRLGDNEVVATGVAADGRRLSDRVRWRRVR